MITKERVAEDWQFGLAPYNRKYPPPQVCFLALFVVVDGTDPADYGLKVRAAFSDPSDRGRAGWTRVPTRPLETDPEFGC